MNVFNKVTLESLKKNRTRTIVTIIGIMLSAAMICASTTLVSSMQNFVLRCAIHIDGDWYGAVYDAAYRTSAIPTGFPPQPTRRFWVTRRSTAPTSASPICMCLAAMWPPAILRQCRCISF